MLKLQLLGSNFKVRVIIEWISSACTSAQNPAIYVHIAIIESFEYIQITQ